MGDHDGCVGEGALDVADGLFFVFIANQATDLEWEKTGGVETGCGCGCGGGGGCGCGGGGGCGCRSGRSCWFCFWATIMFFIPRLIESDMLLQLFVFFFLV